MDYNLEYLSQEKERGIIRDARGPSGEREVTEVEERQLELERCFEDPCTKLLT